MAHVAADSSSSSVADQLSVRLGQEYRVKLGRSFTFPEQNSFHTIKYDFKPQSVDSTKSGHLQVTDDEVNVSLPVVGQGDSEDFTQFRGNKKPCMKECILIINTRTGEAILEKISNNVNLKAVRDGRKPQVVSQSVNRDRSVSPSPFMMQSKGHQATKSQLSTGGHRHLTPSPIPTSTPPTSNSSTPLATKGGGASATSGNGNKKGQKRQAPKSKMPKSVSSAASVSATVKQESGIGKAGNGRKPNKPKAKKKAENSSKQPIPMTTKMKSESSAALSSTAHLAPTQSMPVLGVSGMELSREISPIQSSNPTPEPILPPSRKKPKLTENSSSSSSDSSDSDSEGEEPFSNAPPFHNQAPPQFSTVPVTRVPTVVTTHSQQSSSMPVFSAGRPSVAQKSHIAQKSQSQLLQHGGVSGMPIPRPAPPQQKLSSASSSDSDSDSSSGSSSSDSSSDSSDEENDKEVAALSGAQAAQRSYTRSFSELKTDLHLSSDSGSSSD